MSQVTRCPACQTRFKVVADQLRISDGWVRCGNCQQVFDASASLQPAAPEPMLADMPLNELRGPVARPVPAAPMLRAWGEERVLSKDPTQGLEEIADAEAMDGPEDGFAPTELGLLYPQADDLPPASPLPAPSFLTTTAPRGPAFLSSGSMGLAAEEVARASEEYVQVRAEKQEEGRAHGPAETSPVPAEVTAQAGLQSVSPHGYELPAPNLDEADTEWPALFEESADTTGRQDAATSAERGDALELDLAHFIAEISGAPKKSDESIAALSAEPMPVQLTSSDAEHEVVVGRLDAADELDELHWSLEQDGTEPAYPSLAPTEVPAPTTVLQVGEDTRATTVASADPAAPSDTELSFVRRARRRAFWSGTGVRVGLALLAMGLLLGLLAQIALRERARLAAAWPQSRPILEMACTHLQCSVGMHRDIGSVLVDGSAFNRVQGDRYQFSLTLRNRAALPVEAPAIELTLTDAQDQPVLRRTLLPAELSVPNPLRPGQEWSTVVPMTLGPGAARVAGYRVLAFYP